MYGAEANSRHVEPTIIVVIRFYGYVSADAETYGRNLPPRSTQRLFLLPPGNGSSSPSSDTPPPPTGSPDALTIPPVPRRYTLRDQSRAVGAARREERPVLEALDVLHHASPGPAAAQGPGTEAQLDAPSARGPIHWNAAVFAVMTGFVLPTAHLVIVWVAKVPTNGATLLAACLRRDRAWSPVSCF